ncbi:MAG TPA: four helix bundle protein [bacterium]|nr:four helix bundle protein [bacterium]
MNREELKKRTKRFALQIIGFVEKIPKTYAGRVIENQILRSGVSVGANYRAVCKAKSRKDFINKLNIVAEEADETQYWLELLAESGMIKHENTAYLYNEAREITAMATASIRTARQNGVKKYNL